MSTLDDMIHEGHELRPILQDVAKGAPAADMADRVHHAVRNRRRTQVAVSGAGLALVGLAVTSAALPALRGPSEGRAVVATAPEQEAARPAPATWAQVHEGIVWADATTTAKQLTALGFELQWTHFMRNGDGKESPKVPVDAAPAGAQVQVVLDGSGKPNGTDRPDSSRLLVEAVTLAPDAMPTDPLEVVFPDAAAVIDEYDPQKTAEALEELGYKVVWHLVTPNPEYDPALVAALEPGERYSAEESKRYEVNSGRIVKAPPAGTKITTVGTETLNSLFTAHERDSRTIGIEIVFK